MAASAASLVLLTKLGHQHGSTIPARLRMIEYRSASDSPIRRRFVVDHQTVDGDDAGALNEMERI